MMSIRTKLASLTLVWLLACGGVSLAAQGVPGEAKADVPMKVTSDRMRYNHADQTVTFDGQVAVTREDFRLWANEIVVYLAKGATSQIEAAASTQPSGKPRPAGGGKGTGEDNIDRIEAKGNVRMEREGKTGECENAVYQVKDGVVTMRGNPVLREGQNQIQGDTIKFYLKENRSEVLGGPKSKVEAVFVTTPKGPGAR